MVSGTGLVIGLVVFRSGVHGSAGNVTGGRACGRPIWCGVVSGTGLVSGAGVGESVV